MKKRNKGPSCLGSMLLFIAVVLVLKYAYGKLPDNTVDESVSEKGDRLYDMLLEGLGNYSTEIEFGWDCTEELFDTLERVRGDHPEMFWVSGSGTYKKYTRGDEVTVKFFADTDLTLVEILRCRKEAEKAVDEILAGVNDGWTDYEKLIYIHDTLVSSTEYDSECAEKVKKQEDCPELWRSSSIYGCLVDHRAICSGYAAAFQLLAGEMGIDCIRVSGYERETGSPHEWNCVQLGEKWYYVDVTWDDPRYETSDSAFAGSVLYEYFMVTEEVLSLTHVIGEDEAVPICDDDSFGYYRRNGTYLDEYSFEDAAGIIGSQLSSRMVCLSFGSQAEAEEAVRDLFENSRFYDIPESEALGAVSVVYSVGKTGLLRIAICDPE